MIEILIALIAVTGFGVYGAAHGYKTSKVNLLNVLFCPIMAVFGFSGLLIYVFMAFSYFGAEHKAKIINKEYGSSYTQQEVFYASSVIDEIRNLNRQRIEINGDLFQEK